MDDSALEREIEGLLSVDPAPDFRARVRQRLAQEPPLRAGRSLWRGLWPLGVGTLAAAAAVAFVLGVDSPSGDVPALVARPIREVTYGPLTPSRVASSPLRATASAPPSRARVDAPPVDMRVDMIVHAPEAAAWRRLLASIHSGAIDLSPLARAADQSTPLPMSEDFVLPQIVIEPLAPELSEQGVRP